MTIQSIATSDFQSLSQLKIQAKNDAKQALPEVAKQFEGIFLQSMLKSMRMGQHFLEESNPLSGKNQSTFQEMLDGQYASQMADSHRVGLADMLVRQLENTVASGGKQVIDGLSVFKGPSNEPLVSEPMENSVSPTIDGFVKSIWPLAKQAASMIGLDPKILLAQVALETGWGKHIAKDANGTSNNLFNIKAKPQNGDNAVTVKTTEYIANTPIKMNASFRKYSSLEQSFNDYIALVQGSERYQEALHQAGDPEHYVNALHKAGYASDPAYGSKILQIYHGDELNKAIQQCELSETI